MHQYLKTMSRILEEGTMYPDRTGVGRLTVFHAHESYPLAGNVVPMVTTRKMYMKPLLSELFGMIKGSMLVKDLGEKFWGGWSPDETYVKEHIQRQLNMFEGDERIPQSEIDKMLENAKNHAKIGTIGPMYGVLWRQWPIVNSIGDFSWIKSFDDIPSDRRAILSQEFDRVLVLSNGQMKNTQESREQFIGDQYVKSIDQLNKVFLQLKRNPFSTHHRITAFHPALVGPYADPRENVLEGYGALSPCHTLFQFHVNEIQGVRSLDCHLYMGSSDVCLGRPYNTTFYSTLTIMLAHCLDYLPGTFHITSGNTHIYGNHIEQAKEQVKLIPKSNTTVLSIPADKKDLFALTAEDLVFSGYESHPPIIYPANV